MGSGIVRFRNVGHYFEYRDYFRLCDYLLFNRKSLPENIYNIFPYWPAMEEIFWALAVWPAKLLARLPLPWHPWKGSSDCGTSTSPHHNFQQVFDVYGGYKRYDMGAKCRYSHQGLSDFFFKYQISTRKNKMMALLGKRNHCAYIHLCSDFSIDNCGQHQAGIGRGFCIKIGIE